MRRPCIFWNVQRLFDPSGLPVARSLGATGEAWTRKDYRRKISNLAACLEAMTGGETPAVLALAEVESLRVQQDLRDALGWDDLIITDEISPDPSLDGLDVAMMLDGSVFDVDTLQARSIALDNQFSTRDLLEVRVCPLGSETEAVFAVAHWPSRVITEGTSLRFAYSVYLQRLITSALQYAKADLVAADGTITMPSAEELRARWDTPCVVMGDFNDEPYDTSVREALGSTRFPGLVRRRGKLTGKSLVEVDNYFNEKFSLYNPCWRLLFSDDGSMGGTYYRTEWRAYDQVLFSHGALREDSPLRYAPDSVEVIRLPDLDDGAVAMTKGSGTPRRFDRDTPQGVSDHFPLYFELDIDGG